MDARLRALNRFGLGASPGEAGRLDEPRSWLRGQLAGAVTEARDPDLPTEQEIAGAFAGLGEARRARDPDRLQEAQGAIREIAVREASAAVGRRLASERPFLERLGAFWSNHLCVSVVAKALVAPLAGHYERRAIRSHVLGRYEEMVLASARHPAMLLYLDNAGSIGPNSRAARSLGRRAPDRHPRGLNENYARELLELHTLGVDGGYGQADVEALARILTGWTVAGLGGRGGGMGRRRAGRSRGEPAQAAEVGFVFRDELHEPGDKTVLGTRYREDGVVEGEAVIRDLCRHPSTARHLATKLVRHFVADEPPAGAVERIAAVYRSSGGDLREVSLALVELEEAWEPDHRKFRSPQDWLVALFRAVGVRGVPEVTGRATGVLRQLRQPLWAPSSPKGFGDTAGDWADPDALMNRAELSRSVSRRVGRGSSDPRALLEVVDAEPGDPLRTLLADETIDAGERMALAFASPAFQWR